MDFQALVARLELEAQNLKESIAVSQHRLQEIELFLKLGRKFTGKSEQDTNRDVLTAALMSFEPPATQRDRVLDAAAKLLANGQRRSTRELLMEMIGFGVRPGGVDPASTLSTYLSRDRRFSNDNRRGGWTLSKFAAPVDAATKLAEIMRNMPNPTDDDALARFAALASVPRRNNED
jgi:hypothetical protein